MESVFVIQDMNLLAQLKNKIVVVETDSVEMIVPVREAVLANNHLFCIKLHTNQDITAIPFVAAWKEIPLVIYPKGLGAVRDFVAILPILKNLNVKFYFDGAVPQHYAAVQILSSLGIYTGIVINENADWERLTDLMYYALCGKVKHAPIEPFQYVFDTYKRNILVDYGTVFFENSDRFAHYSEKGAKNTQVMQNKSRQKFFYEYTPCAACEGWRICLGKYAGLKDKTACKNFTITLLNLIESIKFKK